MSSGFAGSSTRGLNDLDREIEYRLGKTNFRPPAEPGIDNSKSSQRFESPHDLAPAGKRDLHSAGDVKDQEKMDWLDRQVSAREQGIKPPEDQFPGGAEDDLMEGEVGPEEFHRRVEEKMKKMAGSEEHVCPHCGKTVRVLPGDPCPRCGKPLPKKLSGDNAGFDSRQTDPAKLVSGTEKADNPDLAK